MDPNPRVHPRPPPPPPVQDSRCTAKSSRFGPRLRSGALFSFSFASGFPEQAFATWHRPATNWFQCFHRKASLHASMSRSPSLWCAHRIFVVAIVANVNPSLLPPAVSQQSSFLAKGHDPPRPALHRFFECRPRNPVITGKRDQLLDVRVRVVPLLHHVRQIEMVPRSHTFIREQTGNIVKLRNLKKSCEFYRQ